MSLRPPSSLLFDLDGTLVDSVADIARSANHVRKSLGAADLPDADIRNFVGDGAKKLMERVVADLDMDPREALRRFRAHYADHCVIDSVPYPGVVETLERLSALPMAVVSNKPQEFTERVVEGLGLDRFFGSVVGARSGVPVKPDPALLILAVEELGVDPGRAWMVGDSPNDLLAARRLGCGAAIAVSYGLKDRSVLEAADPDALLDEFARLIDLFPTT